MDIDLVQVGLTIGGVLLALIAKSGILKVWTHIPREIGEALVAFSNYIDDPDQTEEKRQKMLKEWGDVLAIARKFTGR